MPYIDPEIRKNLMMRAASSGELNYLITQHIVNYIKLRSASYSTFNDVLGALEGAKLEFYRRVVVPYEEKKMKENGDVY